MSVRITSEDVFEWRPIGYTIDNVKYAVLLLNHSLDHLNGQKSPCFDNLWQKASLRVAVDGGARYVTPDHKVPDVLSGDFDSVTKEQLRYFGEKGTKIIETPDQNWTDFTKAVKIVVDMNKKTSNGQQMAIESIIAVWALTGRVDQVMANINTLCSHLADSAALVEARDGHYVPIYLIQVQNSISWLLNKGSHVIESNPLSKWCSLVPIVSACSVTTSGFRWNLNKQVLSFGSLISTSNEFDINERFVRIDTDKPLLFSYDISNSNQL